MTRNVKIHRVKPQGYNLRTDSSEDTTDIAGKITVTKNSQGKLSKVSLISERSE